MTAPAADEAHAEKKKMTVSERDVGALTRGLEDWLAGRSAGPGRPTVTGARTPEANGLASTSLLFEVCWADQGGEGGGSALPTWPGWRPRRARCRCSRATTCPPSTR